MNNSFRAHSLWRNTAAVVFSTLLCWATAGSALAAPVWSNGSPNGKNASLLSEFNQAEDFILNFTSNLTGVRFWSMEASTNDYLGSILYSIVSDVSGSPGSTVYASGTAAPTRTAAGTALGLNIFQNDFAISVSGLLAGTYWIELHNGPLSNSGFSDYYWAWTDFGAGDNGGTTPGREFDLTTPGSVWADNGAEHAFVVFGDRVVATVPESTSLALTAMALALLVMRRRLPGASRTAC